MSKATKKEEGLVNDLRNNLKKRYGDRWDKMEKETPETTSKYKMLRFVRGHGKKNAEDAFVLMMEYREKRNVSVVRRRLLDPTQAAETASPRTSVSEVPRRFRLLGSALNSSDSEAEQALSSPL